MKKSIIVSLIFISLFCFVSCLSTDTYHFDHDTRHIEYNSPEAEEKANEKTVRIYIDEDKKNGIIWDWEIMQDDSDPVVELVSANYIKGNTRSKCFTFRFLREGAASFKVYQHRFGTKRYFLPDKEYLLIFDSKSSVAKNGYYEERKTHKDFEKPSFDIENEKVNLKNYNAALEMINQASDLIEKATNDKSLSFEQQMDLWEQASVLNQKANELLSIIKE